MLHGGPIKNKSTSDRRSTLSTHLGQLKIWNTSCKLYFENQTATLVGAIKMYTISHKRETRYLSVHRILLFGLAPAAFVCSKNNPFQLGPPLRQPSSQFVSRQCERRWLYFCLVLGEIKHDTSPLSNFSSLLCTFYLPQRSLFGRNFSLVRVFNLIFR